MESEGAMEYMYEPFRTRKWRWCSRSNSRNHKGSTSGTENETHSKLYNMAPRIAIIYYSTYGHIEKLAVAQQKGIEKAGGTATIFQQVFSNIHPTGDF
jgi:hypothetical protein